MKCPQPSWPSGHRRLCRILNLKIDPGYIFRDLQGRLNKFDPRKLVKPMTWANSDLPTGLYVSHRGYYYQIIRSENTANMRWVQTARLGQYDSACLLSDGADWCEKLDYGCQRLEAAINKPKQLIIMILFQGFSSPWTRGSHVKSTTHEQSPASTP